MTETSEILFEEVKGTGGNLGIITLNRTKALNALSHNMLLAMHTHLKQWAEDDSIKAVVVKATDGRAFCAGGDIRQIFSYKNHEGKNPAQYFWDEYRLNRRIHCYPKPYISLLNGITMGGGVGISLHGSHPVATENLTFAMPETGIGFFPDVGGSYFLPRLPGKVGMYLGLSGARLKAADSCHLGLTPHYVASEKLSDLVDDIANTPFEKDPKEVVSQIIDRYKTNPGLPTIAEYQSLIDEHFSKDTVEEIIESLQIASNDWCTKQANTLETKSPTSLKVTLQQLNQGATLSFDDCMKMEYRLVNRFITAKDFYEGVRAAVIDKDNKPAWSPAALQDITEKDIAPYFAALEKELEFND